MFLSAEVSDNHSALVGNFSAYLKDKKRAVTFGQDLGHDESSGERASVFEKDDWIAANFRSSDCTNANKQEVFGVKAATFDRVVVEQKSTRTNITAARGYDPYEYNPAKGNEQRYTTRSAGRVLKVNDMTEWHCEFCGEGYDFPAHSARLSEWRQRWSGIHQHADLDDLSTTDKKEEFDPDKAPKFDKSIFEDDKEPIFDKAIFDCDQTFSVFRSSTDAANKPTTTGFLSAEESLGLCSGRPFRSSVGGDELWTSQRAQTNSLTKALYKTMPEKKSRLKYLSDFRKLSNAEARQYGFRDEGQGVDYYYDDTNYNQVARGDTLPVSAANANLLDRSDLEKLDALGLALPKNLFYELHLQEELLLKSRLPEYQQHYLFQDSKALLKNLSRTRHSADGGASTQTNAEGCLWHCRHCLRRNNFFARTVEMEVPAEGPFAGYSNQEWYRGDFVASPSDVADTITVLREEDMLTTAGYGKRYP